VPAGAPAFAAKPASTRATKAGSRSLRFVCVMRIERVSIANANSTGSSRPA
jgi:hypothetical protein